jgi:hypothetical protein
MLQSVAKSLRTCECRNIGMPYVEQELTGDIAMATLSSISTRKQRLGSD